MSAPKKTNTVKDFEKSLSKLSTLVEKMENGNLPLDTALKYFEEGVGLIKSCQKTLDETEQKVQELTSKDE